MPDVPRLFVVWLSLFVCVCWGGGGEGGMWVSGRGMCLIRECTVWVVIFLSSVFVYK